ncbi:MAG TPA: AsmA-like C-terminal region-containing protein [Terriglobia bacterium]|nr:AsmA-like C-terminal region-containing protein [Terriglobia bacterium]
MRRWLVVAGFLLMAGAIVAAIVVTAAIRRVPAYVRERAMSTLRERFHCDVQLASFDVSVKMPWVRITGAGLVLRPAGRADLPPLIQVQKFSARAGLIELLRPTKHVGSVRLEGLWIQLPPRGKHEGAPPSAKPPVKKGSPGSLAVVMDIITADQAQLDFLSSTPGRPPRSFEIHHLTYYDAGTGRPMTFHAELTNPRPTGEIVASGQFGPWDAEEPRLTPISGSYTFRNADLSTFRGIAGMLSSDGKYKGVLDRVEVDGEATIPDFQLSASRHSLLLKTQFHSIVDGTSGDTLLQPLRADFLHSALATSGGVVRTPGVKGRSIFLDVTADHARVEDLTRLASKSAAPPITGLASLKTKLELPAGEGDLFDRLKLAGDFRIEQARFTDAQVEQKLGELSRLGQGEPHPEDAGTVLSDLKGEFTLSKGVMTFSDLTFAVPGASVQLQGQYTVHSQEFNFRGTLQLRAKLSQLVHGWKSVLLKPVDPLFQRGKAGMVIPIRITGIGDKPVFKVELSKVFSRKSP